MKKIIEAEIAIPETPNFLRHVVKGRDKAMLFPIADFTDEELREIGKQWTEDLVKKAKKRRKQSQP